MKVDFSIFVQVVMNAVVVTSKPCYIAGNFYLSESFNTRGPFMVTVPPLEQYAKDYVIIAPFTGETFYPWASNNPTCLQNRQVSYKYKQILY